MREGGLELALQSLCSELPARQGIRISMVEQDYPRELTADVFHFHGLWQRAFPAVARECRRKGIPTVISPHGMLEPWALRHKWWKKWLYFAFVERSFLRAADLLLASSDLEQAHLRFWFPKNRIRTIPFGLPTAFGPAYSEARQKLGWAEDTKVLLYLSRLHPKKGLHLLLRSLAQRPDAYSENVRLVIIGSGHSAYVAKLKQFAEENKRRLPKIEWLGEIWSEEKWRYLQAADLFCLPSHSENFGYAILEALQVGTPVLTTRATPWPALISELEAGASVEPAVEAIREKLRSFFSGPVVTPERRHHIAAIVRQRFSWNEIARAYTAAYQQCAERGTSAAMV